jgi:beta-aspartyl-peptidase (threonine type)
MNARLFRFVSFSILFLSSSFNLLAQSQAKYIMVIHGGAGTILKSQMTAERELAYKTKLIEALQTGYAALKSGKSSLE